MKTQKYYLTNFCLLAILYFSPIDVFCQHLELNWQQCYGGSEVDGGGVIVETWNGFVLSGTTYSADGDFPNTYGDGDLFLLWTDTLGGFLSSRTYGGTEMDGCVNMRRCLDGGFIMVGFTCSNDGDVQGHHGGPSGDLWVVKTDSIGAIQWQKCLGSSSNEFESRLLELTPDSGYFVAASAGSNSGDVTGFHGFYDFWLVRLDKYGEIIWQRCYGGTGADLCIGGTKTLDGGLILCGNTDSNDGDVLCDYHGGTGDAWIVKVDSSGTIQWQNCFGGSEMDNISVIYPTPDGGYICAGNTSSNDGQVNGNHGGTDVWVIKIDSLGNLVWQRCFGGSNKDSGYDLVPTAGSNYLIGGYTYSADGDVTLNHSISKWKDTWILLVSPSGTLVWEQCFGGEGHESCDDICPLQDGSFIVSGGTSSSDQSGNVSCDFHTYQGINFGDAWILSITDTSISNISNLRNTGFSCRTYPNPASESITIEYDLPGSGKEAQLFIINQLGNISLTAVLPDNKGTVNFNTQGLSGGIYILTLVIDGVRYASGKVMVVH